MIWILAVLCIGGASLAGFYQGPIRAGFTLAGLGSATLLASPLSPLFHKLLNALGIKHPIPANAVPPILAFLTVVIIFKIIGETVQRKVLVNQKYNEDDARYYLWERMFQRVGISLGAFCGAIYFFALCVPIYSAGYFTSEFFREGEGSSTIRLVNSLREGIVSQKLDRVIAGHDPIPAHLYQTSDTLALLLQNPNLGPRLTRYPVVVAMSENPEFRDLTSDKELLKAYHGNGSAAELLKNEKLSAMLKDPDTCTRLYQLLNDNLTDLVGYLKTGKSEKYDPEKILGNWTINVPASVMLDRQLNAYPTVSQTMAAKVNVLNKVYSVRVTATTDNKLILRRGIAATLNDEARIDETVGSWSKSGDKYQASIPNNKPDSVDVKFDNGRMIFVRDGVPAVFEKQF